MVDAWMVTGRINFDGTREGKALDVLREALIDRDMWEQEWAKKDYENEELRKDIANLKVVIRELSKRKKK